MALITTQGFEDVLAIGRQTRRELPNLNVEKAPELLGFRAEVLAGGHLWLTS